MSFFAVVDPATGDVLEVVPSLDHPAPPGAVVIELPARGDDVTAWLALHGRERGGGGMDEALLGKEQADAAQAARERQLHDAEVFFARLEQLLLRAELEGRRLALLLFRIAPSDQERTEPYVRDVLSAAGQELLPCDVMASLRPHLAAVLLQDADAHGLVLRSPRGETRALTYPDDAGEIEALRCRRHPWLSQHAASAA